MILWRCAPMPSLAAWLDAKRFIANRERWQRRNGPWRTLLPIRVGFYDLSRKLADMRELGIIRR